MFNSDIGKAREARFSSMVDGGPLDVLVVGGGMTGSPLYHSLWQNGYRVGLVDRADYASGTSQASGMLIWGGLLYLKSLDVATVIKLCMAKAQWLSERPETAVPLEFHYLAGKKRTLSSYGIWMALQFYWLLGVCTHKRPSFLPGKHGSEFLNQEGMLRESDSRFVIDQICATNGEHCPALNHCRLASAAFDRVERMWRIDLMDERTGAMHHVKSRVLINAAGVWADELNRLAGLDSPYKHVFSKGVYLMFPGDGDLQARIYPMQGRDDVITQVPWGPVTMWGPTETAVRDLKEGLAPDRDDIRFLLEQSRHCLPKAYDAENVVSIRCGVRPLAVPRNFESDVYPLSLSRRHQVVEHKGMSSLTLYGGKLTTCLSMARQITKLVRHWVTPSHTPLGAKTSKPEHMEYSAFGGRFVSAAWARDQEHCLCLDDYLRRRTNIAQWTPRMGLGRAGENRMQLREIASAFTANTNDADKMVTAYEDRVRRLYDPLFSI